MGEYYVCTSPDFDNEVIDVVLVIDGIECWVKGFDDDEWKDASEFAERLANRLTLDYIGELNLDI